jgi:hypothetical protein
VRSDEWGTGIKFNVFYKARRADKMMSGELE